MRYPQCEIRQFDGGMVLDPRDPSKNVCRTSQHFDLFTEKYKLSPQYSSENGDASAATNQIKNFAYDGTTIYGLGISGANNAVLTRTDFTGSTWTPLGNGSLGTNAESVLFTYYAKTGKLYTAQGLRYIQSITVSGGSFTNQAYDITGGASVTSFSNGVVHPIDDTLYVGVDNKVLSNLNDSWTIALTLPTSLVVTSICVYGSYLAIGCRPLGGSGRSRVLLWDRNSTYATLPETIDWGEGNITLLEELEGYLIGVSFYGNFVNDVLKARMVAKYYNGTGGAVTFRQFTGTVQNGYTTPLYKAKSQDRILFPALFPIETTDYYGIWSISRSSSGVPFAVTLESLYRQVLTTGTIKYGLIKIGDYLFTSYTASSVFQMDKTDDTKVFSTSSVYTSTINPGMTVEDRVMIKQLRGVWATYEALPSGSSVTVDYRVNGGAWVNIFTESTVSNTRTSPFAKTTSNGEYSNGNDIEFRITSTGGAEITSLCYTYEVIQK